MPAIWLQRKSINKKLEPGNTSIQPKPLITDVTHISAKLLRLLDDIDDCVDWMCSIKSSEILSFSPLAYGQQLHE
jgi:hypothetical protein